MATASQPGSFPAKISEFPGGWLDQDELPTGTWHVMANGRIFTLDINKKSDGSFAGTLSNSNDTQDFEWHGATHKITFKRILSNVGPSGTETRIQPFIGYLMAFDQAHEFKWRIAGSFETEDEKGCSLFPTASWYATTPRNEK